METPEIATLGPSGKLWDAVLATAAKMKPMHEKIKKTALELGELIHHVAETLANATSEERKEQRLPSFTIWMRDYCEELCGFPERSGYRYYAGYKESLAAGLTPETIRALAPNILKEEKPRKAVLRAIQETPQLAAKLNEAQGNLKAIKEIAKSAEVKDIVQAAKPQAVLSPWERVKETIVSRFERVFSKAQPETSNKALKELVQAFNMACEELGIAEYIEVKVIAQFEPEDIEDNSMDGLKAKLAALQSQVANGQRVAANA